MSSSASQLSSPASPVSLQGALHTVQKTSSPACSSPESGMSALQMGQTTSLRAMAMGSDRRRAGLSPTYRGVEPRLSGRPSRSSGATRPRTWATVGATSTSATASDTRPGSTPRPKKTSGMWRS